LFLIYPVFSVFAVSFLTRPAISRSRILNFFGPAFYQQSLWNSLAIPPWPTLATTLRGDPWAFLPCAAAGAGKIANPGAAALPLVLPSLSR